MPERAGPEHDKLVLTQAEQRVLADLQRDLDGSAGGGFTPVAAPGWRYRLLAACHRWMRWGPLLLPAGAVLMLWAVSRFLVISALGAMLMALGMAACFKRPWRKGPGQGRARRGRITPPG